MNLHESRCGRGFAALLMAMGLSVIACGSQARDAESVSSGAAGSSAGSGGSSGGSAGTDAVGGTSNAGSAGTAGTGGSAAAPATSGLKDKYESLFPVGVALEPADLQNHSPLITAHFNHLTVGNAMKFGPIHPQENTWDTAAADALVEFARSNAFGLTCHTLLWHRQQPAWLFEGLTAGDAESIETLKSRMQAHIAGMIERYADDCDNWDVVNEAISDDPSKSYRDAAEGSKWYEIFGSEEYVYWAFKYARDALEAHEPGSSSGKLYYNEYNETQKADRILEMVSWLKDTHGIQVDGIGMQAHFRLDWPTASEIGATIDKFAAAGLKVKISELDITVYNDYPPPSYSFTPAAEVAMTPELEITQAQRYKELFALFRQKAESLTSVTVWGISDDESWLDTHPVTRNDYPLLFDDDDQPKEALGAIMDF